MKFLRPWKKFLQHPAVFLLRTISNFIVLELLNHSIFVRAMAAWLYLLWLILMKQERNFRYALIFLHLQIYFHFGKPADDTDFLYLLYQKIYVCPRHFYMHPLVIQYMFMLICQIFMWTCDIDVSMTEISHHIYIYIYIWKVILKSAHKFENLIIKIWFFRSIRYKLWEGKQSNLKETLDGFASAPVIHCMQNMWMHCLQIYLLHMKVKYVVLLSII